MGDRAVGRLERAALLGRARGRLLVDDTARRAACRSRRAGHACELLRSGRLRDLGRAKIADRIRVGACRAWRAAPWKLRRVGALASRACATWANGPAPDLRRRV